MSDRVTARCILSRQIGDDLYTAGETYEMERERATRYALYFQVLPEPSPAPEAKDQGPGEDKQRKPRPENKRKAE